MGEHQETKEIELNIPTTSGDQFTLLLKSDDRVFVVGANGSGKSALIQHVFSSQADEDIPRIPAHRQTWFHTDTIDISAWDRSRYKTNHFYDELEDQARWTDKSAEQKQSVVLFDLVDSENLRARTIARFVDNHEMETARKTAAASASSFDRINKLLEIGALAIALEYSNRERVLARHHSANKPFSIAQMSDGERSAAIIAARVLTVVPGTMLLIDEPERHLHPSISAPFLSALFQERSDCPFVVATNDIALPAAHPEARVLLVRSCTWEGDKAMAWDVELLESNADLPEDLRRAILGSRKRILFVEGDDASSLDLPLYSALYPGISILPRGSCADVLKAVSGLRGSKDLHHVEAFGLIDRDNRSNEEVQKLAKGFVFALDVFSVETLYYCSDAVAAVAHRQAESLGRDADEMFESAKKAALDALHGNDLAERMAARRCERIVRNQIGSCLPNWKDIMGNSQVNFSFSVASPFPSELALFMKLLSNSELDQMTARYPLRETDALDAISRTLEFRTRELYQQTLLARVRDDAALAQKLRERIGPLSSILCK